MDDVKKLLADFADHAVDGMPPADVDADVARGRRALRRIRARRRVTGVLCIAAATTAVLAFGQLKWWAAGQSQVAGGSEEAAQAPNAGATASPAASPSPQDADGPMAYSASAVSLIANKEAWNTITCSLTPQGWTAQEPVGTDHVLLAPPSMRTGDLGENDGLDVRAEPQARSLTAIRMTEAGGKVFQLGTTGGRESGQVLLGDRWLLVQLPEGNLDWNDELLRRFMASCTVN